MVGTSARGYFHVGKIRFWRHMNCFCHTPEYFIKLGFKWLLS